MNIELFESFKVDIKKSCEENVCFCPRDSISYQDKVPSSSIKNEFNLHRIVHNICSCTMLFFQSTINTYVHVLFGCLEYYLDVLSQFKFSHN